MSAIYKKPNGMVLEVHDLSISYVESLGWVEESVLDNRGLPWDERLNQKNRAMTEHGNWKYKQGVTAESAEKIELELLG